MERSSEAPQYAGMNVGDVVRMYEGIVKDLRYTVEILRTTVQERDSMIGNLVSSISTVSKNNNDGLKEYKESHQREIDNLKRIIVKLKKDIEDKEMEMLTLRNDLKKMNGSISPLKTQQVVQHIDRTIQDKRILMTPENSILNDPNATIDDIKFLIEYKMAIKKLTADENGNNMRDIISRYNQRLVGGQLNDSNKYDVISVILTYDQSLHFSQNAVKSRLSEFIHVYAYHNNNPHYGSTMTGNDQVEVSYARFHFSYKIINGKKYVHAMMFEGRDR